MIWHNSTVEQVADELGCNINTGLTSKEAELRLKEYGKNELKHDKKTSFSKYLCANLFSFARIILIIVAIINLILAFTTNSNDKTNYIIIIATVIFSSMLAALFKYISDTILYNASAKHISFATVIRDGNEITIKSHELVPGDVMLIRAGDYIKADGRLIDSYALTCDETMVSGDMAPAEKIHDALYEDITPLLNRHNMVYSGSLVLGGKGTVLVTETGLATESGMHQDLKKQLEDTDTPIKTRLLKISHTTSVIAFVAAIITFFLGIAANFSSHQFAITVSSNLLLSLCLYYSAFSNLIPNLLTFSRACSVRRLQAKKIIINSKITTEELKDVTVICTDKTGVLTTEELKIVKVFNGIESVDLSNSTIDESTAAVLRLALICSNFSRTEHGERHTNNVERSIETACVNALGMSKIDIDGLYPKIAELPFDSNRMLMTTVTAINSCPVSVTKGAPEVVFSRCNNIDIEEAEALTSSYAKEGLKVIAVAIKQLDEIPVNPTCEELENDLTFVGVLGMVDEISPKAAKLCIDIAKQGIKTIMVTGDHKDTAIAISKKAGIITDDSQAISGEELAALNDDELAATISNYTVFARILPEDKQRIVAALKANNEKVLITGDSVKDTQALIDADFGCALGYTASDMVKDSADLVIEDNHYSSIIYAIKESASIYANTKKALIHTFTVGISAILLTLFGLLIFGKSPLVATALVLHSLLIIALPLFAIFTDNIKRNSDLSSKGSKFFDKFFLLRSLVPSIVTVTLSLISFGLNLKGSITSACGAAFIVLTCSEIVGAICTLVTGSLFTNRILKYRIGIIVCLISFLLLIVLALTPIGAFLSLSSFSASAWQMSLIAVLLVIISHESVKFYKKIS